MGVGGPDTAIWFYKVKGHSNKLNSRKVRTVLANSGFI